MCAFVRRFEFLALCLVSWDSVGILDWQPIAFDGFRNKVNEIRVLQLSFDTRQTSQQHQRLLRGSGRVNEITSADALSAGIKGTLGKVYYLSTFGTGMLFIKFV
jgi:hypothetical protein